MNEFLAGLRGVSRVIDVTDKGRKLGDIRENCKFVKLSNWNADDDLAQTANTALVETSGNEIFYGFDGVLAHQLFPARETEFLPCENLSQINVKTRDGVSRKLFFTFFY